MAQSQDYAITQEQIRALTDGHRDNHNLVLASFMHEVSPNLFQGPLKVTDPRALLLMAECAEEFNYISHVKDTVIVIRWGRAMASRGEGARRAKFTEAGELIRCIMLQVYSIMFEE